MNPESFQLSIPTPCQEDWNQMIPEGNNKHCQKCSTLIVDFTQMSDREIKDFFENHQGRICGRMTKRQTEKIYSSYSEEKTTSFYLPRIAASWLLVSWLSLSPTVNAQELKPEMTEQVSKGATDNQTVTPRILKGIVIDTENNEPLTSVEIYIDTNLISKTDLDGNFTLEIPDNISDTSTVIFSFGGFKSQLITLDKINFRKPLSIQMESYPITKWVDASTKTLYRIPPQNSTSRILKGTITGVEINKTLYQANIYIANTKIRVKSDFDGNFVLNIPDSIPNQSEITFYYVGYEPKKIAINTIDFSKPLNIRLEEEMGLIGELVITKERIIKRKNKRK